MARLTVLAVVLTACGPPCEPCGETTATGARSAPPSSVSTRPDIDDDYACVARMTGPRGEAGATFGFSRHADGTRSTRTSTLALEDASCVFEGSFDPAEVEYLPAASYGILRSAVRCQRGEATHAEESEAGARIAFVLGDDLAVRFDCTDTGLVEVIPGKT